MAFEAGDLMPQELVQKLAFFTHKINREIAVYLDRKGTVTDISIGDSSTVSLPELEGRKSKMRLSGIRCIHTHPNGTGQLSSVDISSLINLRLDAMIALGVKDGELTEAYVSIPSRAESGEFDSADLFGPYQPGDPELGNIFGLIIERDKNNKAAFYDNDVEEERAILVGLETLSGRMIGGKSEAERSLDELEELANTSGAVVIEKILQKKPVKDPAFYIGRGKAEEIGLLCQAAGADTLIFDVELSGAQVRNIEDVTGAKVVDRTTLILDIFAQRARSKEGKLQVELAQLKYRLPRLTGMGGQLSRLGGGIGTRGPGEKKLEVDKRHIRRRINFLESELDQVSIRRNRTREARKKNTVPSIALVGYTNAGKSTLMNKLCNCDVFAENKLFATLDPTARKLQLADGKTALLVDTVGFIRKLPHELVDAFKSTLEEVVYSDILLHVVDVSNEEAEEQIAVVMDILESLEALQKSMILVLNKIDMVNGKHNIRIPDKDCKIFEVSAVTGQGIPQLISGISELLSENEINIEFTIPYNQGWILPYMYENGKVMETDYKEDGIRVKAVIRDTKIEKIKEFLN
ncbi:GTPase HflX [Pseudobacteroides cellulosolvens]|uniref:GTPase HflX n=1 Tax=Pseudobacteroides cellulosolvens ATCC 35603 = DSM 2933 TaxID=398512 RepID=A0A0L6JXV9_9FIRM|nr:GTPase HflX [Pseudobacteroides cellulosolvens]KNY30395.1 GTP-binding protein, HflX [Pseudobacteroides cellulosolvens ATCC 35603 = DSM 2933]